MVSSGLHALEGIKAVVFDAYGTLFNVGSAVEKMSGELQGKAPELIKLWRQKQLEYTWLRSLTGAHADFWTVTKDALDYALQQLGIDEPGLADGLMTQYLKLDAYDDVKTSLAQLRGKGLRLAILSNGSPSMLDSQMRHAELEGFFEQVISVEDVGIYKPSRRVYRLAMQKLHIPDAPSIGFVSANTWDAQSAALFGFQVIRIARLPTPDDNIPGRPKYIIESLMQLTELM